jgi:GNAT superfamily N-acetyltransferase
VSGVTIRRAAPGDEAEILRLIVALAVYEKEPDAVHATEAGLAEALFADGARVSAHLAVMDGAVVGLALWFLNFSTWTGRPGLYLEDLFVEERARGSGAGGALLTTLAREAVAAGCARMEWAVLDWNETAMGFYRSIGAARAEGWQSWRLSGAALARLAGA